ncbi:MAG TPA: hypothetical protein VFZ10_14855 [Geminicoccaceae bacterium]
MNSKSTDGQAAQHPHVQALLERHGQTYAAELGIDLERNTSSALYR